MLWRYHQPSCSSSPTSYDLSTHHVVFSCQSHTVLLPTYCTLCLEFPFLLFTYLPPHFLRIMLRQLLLLDLDWLPLLSLLYIVSVHILLGAYHYIYYFLKLISDH